MTTNGISNEIASQLFAGLLVILFSSLIVYLCWNNLVPEIFNLPRLSFFKAFLLYILCSSLFKPTSVSVKR